MLQSHLSELATFDGQFETGLLRAQQLWKAPIEEVEQEDFMRLNYDWITAFTSADRMCGEIKQLLQGQIYPAYPVHPPLATGGTCAHMHAVMQQAGYCATSIAPMRHPASVCASMTCAVTGDPARAACASGCALTSAVKLIWAR